MNLEKQKEKFKNHIAKFTDYGNIKILDFKNPESNHYRIRFLFEEDYCRLHISGDLGELIATNYYNMTFNKFGDFANNTGYFEEKVDCHNRPFYYYDLKAAREELTEYFKDSYLLDEEEIEDVLDDILLDFSDDRGISGKGYDALLEIDSEGWEYVYNVGKKRTVILDVYMLAFKLATEQLKGETYEEVSS